LATGQYATRAIIALMITAVVLAAGLSRRMGQFKLLLPWNGRTVLEQVITVLQSCGIADVLVVTGHRSAEVTNCLERYSVRTVVNPHYADGEMQETMRLGLSLLPDATTASLLCLGDQPQMEEETIRLMLIAHTRTPDNILIPSFEHHAGHPILIPTAQAQLFGRTNGTLREFVRAQPQRVSYVEIPSSTILADLDTPADYERWQGM
jgi:molybdenum cofactor cytidylyltransferase